MTTTPPARMHTIRKQAIPWHSHNEDGKEAMCRKNGIGALCTRLVAEAVVGIYTRRGARRSGLAVLLSKASALYTSLVPRHRSLDIIQQDVCTSHYKA